MDQPLVESPAVPREAVARRFTMVEHLEELRRRLWVCILVLCVTSLASFGWAGRLVDWLRRPGGAALPRLAFFSPSEAMLAYMQVAVTSGLVLSLPVLLYELWAFVSPGLTRRERHYGLAFVWCGTGLFLAGVAFAYWALLPISLQFLLQFGGGQLEPVISISHYLSFTTTVLLVCGAVFQLPLVVFLLAKLGVVTPRFLRRQWRQAVLIIIIAAAVLTPTSDAATLLLMTVPLLALYEVSIWIAVLAAGRRQGHA